MVLAFGWTGSASSTPITVDGKEWLQPIDFINLSWNDINGVCSGATGECNGSLNGNDVTGWVWAGVDDVNALFNHYIGYLALGPGPDAVSSPFSAYTSVFFNDGWELTTGVANDLFIEVEGWTRDQFGGGLARTASVVASTSDYTDSFYAYATNDAKYSVSPYPLVGAWFSRLAGPSVAVPIPATFPLVVVGLAALGYSRRKRKLLS